VAQTYDVPLFINDKFEISPQTFIPAVYKAVNEVLDNVLDEYANYRPVTPLITIKASPEMGTYTISDTGRGVPIGMHSSGKPTPEVVFGSLRSGRNFVDTKKTGVIGMNGMGVSLTCITSTDFQVTILRDNKKYQQSFKDGGLKVTKPTIRKTTKKETGTEVFFNLDPVVFGDVSLPSQMIKNRAMEIALTNPGIQVNYNGTKYRYPTGFERVIKKITMSGDEASYYKFSSKTEQGEIEFYVVYGVHAGLEEKIFTWVNSSLLFDGGICNTQFLNAYCDKVVTHLDREAKKKKCVVTKNDIRQNLLVFGNLKVANPEYDAQSKTRLTGPNLRKPINDLIDEHWKVFVRKNKEHLNTILERAVVRHHGIANKKAVQQLKKNLNKKVPGLVDAVDKNRAKCNLLITEGLSAASSITEARDPMTIASFPLTGKINNVHGATVAQLLKMGKITDLLTAIGLVPGHKALKENLRYGKIIIATDADVDGGDIFTLLVNLFFQFWPELFDSNPIVYRLVAPNVCLTKGNKRIHFTTREEYNRVKSKYKSYTVDYYKGLGSMVKQDWQMILSGRTNTLIPVINDGTLTETLDLLFGPNVEKRKEWLQNEAR
jgi:DNA gyrase/topoisomerase IV subunit B